MPSPLTNFEIRNYSLELGRQIKAHPALSQETRTGLLIRSIRLCEQASRNIREDADPDRNPQGCRTAGILPQSDEETLHPALLVVAPAALVEELHSLAEAAEAAGME